MRDDEFEPWTRLFRGYADFYHWPTSDEHQRQIWGWIHEDRTVEALVAVAGRRRTVPRPASHRDSLTSASGCVRCVA